MKKLPLASWGILGISLILTSVIFVGYWNELNKNQYHDFEIESIFITDSILDRLSQYEQVLVGGQALFAASEKVTLQEWKTFVVSQNIEERFPGIQGVGYIQSVSPENREDFINEMRDYGVDEYEIKPSGERGEYCPVKFLEPLDLRNQQAIGYDVYSEETRKTAIDIAKQTGKTTITGKIILVQEIDKDIQNGFLMLVPSYNESGSIHGMVYAVFRMNDFLSGTVNQEPFERIHLKIYDDFVSDENLFFDSSVLSGNFASSSDYSSTLPVSINNRNWVFVYDEISHFTGIEESIILTAIPLVGYSMSFLLFYIFRLISKNLSLTRASIRNERITAIGTMASRMSHDLRNPLTVAKSNFELLKMHLGEGVDDKTKKYEDRIDESVKAISDIIEDALEFTKTSELKKEKTTINTILENTVSNINVPENVQINLPENDFELRCDKNKMESVFANMITNSIQSMEDEGIITISTKKDYENLEISIVDSGPGIPSENIRDIFEPLFTTKHKGTGLGLSICKDVLEQHGGSISVKNKPTTFTLRIPIS